MSSIGPNTSVFAYHGPLIYEAKVLKVHRAGKSFIDGGTGKETFEQNPKFKQEELMNVDTYYLHYQGWKSKWDEWVTLERILENNEENRYKKKELDQLTKRKRTAPSPAATLNSSTNGTASKDKKVERKVKKQKQGAKKGNPHLHLEFNNQLKYLLVDDWEYITKDKKIIELPSKNPVSHIIKEYSEYRKTNLNDKVQLDVLDEVLLGLELYFNKSLSLNLLYKYENLQYLELLKEDKINTTTHQSEVYGIEHFLRLMILFPGLISDTTMDGVSISVLMNEITEILSFLTKNLTEYTNNYIYASPQYDSLARS